MAVISVTDKVAQSWLSTNDKALDELQTQLDAGEATPGFEFDLKVAAKIDVDQVRQTGRNVIARWQVGRQPSEQVVVVGAHVDHLGTGTSSSLAREDEKGQIHPGADDNASGVADMMEIAEHFASLPTEARRPMKRDVIFAAWSGEELGLQGSKHFVEVLQSAVQARLTQPVSSDGPKAATTIYPRVAAYLNMDMVGRFRKSLALQGLGSSDFWKREIQRLAIVTNLPIQPSDDTFLPTDATSFYLAGVPVINAFTGVHPDYHTPRDTPDKLDYDHAAQIARFMGMMTEVVSRAEDAPNYIEHKNEARPMAQAGAVSRWVPSQNTRRKSSASNSPALGKTRRPKPPVCKAVISSWNLPGKRSKTSKTTPL